MCDGADRELSRPRDLPERGAGGELLWRGPQLGHDPAGGVACHSAAGAAAGDHPVRPIELRRKAGFRHEERRGPGCPHAPCHSRDGRGDRRHSRHGGQKASPHIDLPSIITHHYFPGGLDPLANACGTHPVEILSYGSERMHTELERHGIDVGMIASVEVSLGLPRVRGWKVGSFPFLVALPKASRLANRGPSASTSLRPSLSAPSSGCSFRWRGPGAGYSACEGCRRGPCVGAGGEQLLGKARNPRRSLCATWQGRGRHLGGGVHQDGPRVLPQQGTVPGKSR